MRLIASDMIAPHENTHVRECFSEWRITQLLLTVDEIPAIFGTTGEMQTGSLGFAQGFPR